jgi:serine/threonine-protein kinase
MTATAPPKLPRGGALRVAPTVAVGAVLDGKYRVESVLGRGGMALVVAARHETLGHRVALKLLRPEASASPQYAQRALREARAAAALTSEHVTQVLDVGQLDSGQPYIVMELLEGSDFGAVLRERGPLAVRDVATYLVQACDAIAEAHGRGIVHRDLKPGNLFLARRRDGSPLVKLMDFGISKMVEGSPDEALTATQDSLGTPHYMSPEQLLSARDVDTRTDVWALGVLAFRLLTGAYPFVGETAPAVHIAIASVRPPRLRDVRPDAPVAVDDLIARCLTKSRTDRLQTVVEFARTLLPFADEDTRRRYASVGEVSVPVTEAPADDRAARASPEPDTRATWGTNGEPAARPRLRAGAVAAAVVVVAAGAGAVAVMAQSGAAKAPGGEPAAAMAGAATAAAPASGPASGSATATASAMASASATASASPAASASSATMWVTATSAATAAAATTAPIAPSRAPAASPPRVRPAAAFPPKARDPYGDRR